MGEKQDGGLTYSDSGVDIDRADRLVDRIKDKIAETHTDGVVGGIGGFGGLFAPNFEQYEKPILVAGTDGVGTKLKIAQKMKCHDSIGIDLVAMCVNDILVQGAQPLFFLDYLASGKLDVAVNEAIVAGIVDGCKQAGAALIGGETAEMPGFYPDGEYDVAGFAVGIVDESKVITGEDIRPGDILLGLPSSGVHSNGFSLIRYLLEQQDDLNLNTTLSSGKKLGEVLLTPTRIYAKQLLPLFEEPLIKGISHITGGGLLENLPRILPDKLQAQLYPSRWPELEIFNFVQQNGNIAKKEMYRTFNMGIGLVLAVRPQDKELVVQKLREQDEKVYDIGLVEEGSSEVVLAGDSN